MGLPKKAWLGHKFTRAESRYSTTSCVRTYCTSQMSPLKTALEAAQGPPLPKPRRKPLNPRMAASAGVAGLEVSSMGRSFAGAGASTYLLDEAAAAARADAAFPPGTAATFKRGAFD